MKKFLTILWVIIILGSVFIAINIFKPDVFDLKNKILKNNSDVHEKTAQEQEQQPQTYEEYIKQGETYLKENLPIKAYGSFDKALKLEPNSLKAQLGIVQSYLNDRQFEEARDYLILLDQTKTEVKYYNSIILILFKDFNGAKTIFTALEPGKENKTISEYSKKFLEKYKIFESYKEGEQIFLQTLLSKALTEVNQSAAAIPLLYDVISQNINYRDAWIILGYAYLKTGKTEDAIDAFSKVQTKFPDNTENLFFLGLAYFANNDFDRAAYYMEEADKKGYEPKDMLNMKLGDIYLQQKKYEDAVGKYEEVLAVNTTNIDVFTRAIWIYIEKLNNPGNALKLAQKAATAFPNKAMSYNLLGWAYMENNDFKKAKENLGKALELDPTLKEAQTNLEVLQKKEESLNTQTL
jgi:tetratricopeptide (TPR) repeat protein